MDLSLSAADAAFRDEVRQFLDAHLTEELRAGGRLTTGILSDHALSQRWQKILYRKGWAAPAWPEQYGGTGWSAMQRYLFASECARAGAPRLSPLGLQMVGPVLIGHGSEAQRAHYLP
ncbi:MAG TPA: acyl-CoA dehydrogenase family protein, partial [Alphaproteobacteria bacterium]|nr:acyl-CoA dehydrogenase family protein [Alphaproteobacteria bacterium]